MGVIIVLSLAAIPFGVLITSLRDRSLRRRSRFRLRFTGFVICMVAPWLIELPRAVSQRESVTPLWLGLGWGLLLVALAPFLLFRGAESDPGHPDDGGPDPSPEDDPQPPHPVGGLPLPDAEQPARRVRGPHAPGRATHPRRPAREPERRPSAPSRV